MTKGALDKLVDDLVEWYQSVEGWTLEDIRLKQDLKNLINRHAPHRLAQIGK